MLEATEPIGLICGESFLIRDHFSDCWPNALAYSCHQISPYDFLLLKLRNNFQLFGVPRLIEKDLNFDSSLLIFQKLKNLHSPETSSLKNHLQ